MPCTICSSPLLVSHKYEDLRCPNCSNLSTVPLKQVEVEVQNSRDLLGEDRVLELLKQYKKTQLILALLRMGNKAANRMWEDRGFPIRDFAIPPAIIKKILPESGFGNDTLDVHSWPPETLDTVLSHHFLTLKRLSHLEEQFVYAYPKVPEPTDHTTLFTRFDIYPSEYDYCFMRCLRSLMGGDFNHRDQFDKVELNFRDFDTTPGDELETVREFGETFYEFIVAMSFLLSNDELMGDTYHHEFPEDITTFDIRRFIDSLDLQFYGDALDIIEEEGELATTGWNELQAVGQDVFGEDWQAVRDDIVMRPGNPDAHPFLFAMPVEEEAPGSRVGSQVTIDIPRAFYGHDYSQFIRFQMYPLLHDENGTIGGEILKGITEDRGKPYERNIYEYLQNEGFEVYHSLEHYGDNDHELDLLVVASERDEIWFIECKYKLPYMRMNTADGIEDFNGKMYDAVFDHGEPFDEKVDWWLANKPGDNFTWQEGAGESDRTFSPFPEEWENMTVRRLVVSNLVPSFTVSRGVRFITGLEFVQFLESETLPYLPKHERWVEGTLPKAR